MNRNCLSQRLARAPWIETRSSAANRFRCHLESLEDRKLLTVSTTYIDDNWVDLTHPGGTLTLGDELQNLNDTINPGGVDVTYGVDGFGTISNVVGAHTIAGAGLIHNAIEGTAATGTVNILEGTYAESDIVIDQSITVTGAGQTGTAATVIVPETASTEPVSGDPNFAAGTHQGFIINAASVTVEHLTLDGNGNTGVTGSLAYHQGITTLYDAPGGYASLHNGTVTTDDLGNQAASALDVEEVTVKNTAFHGIALSAPASESYNGMTVSNATVSNIGATGSQDTTKIGILMQNANTGAVLTSTVTNAGVGIATNVFGNATFGSNSGARNLAEVQGCTVTNAVTEGYSAQFAAYTIQTNPLPHLIGFHGNTATFSPGNSAIGLYLNFSQVIIGGMTISGAKIGIEIQNTSLTTSGSLPIIPIIAAATTIAGPGTGVSGSVGILSENSVAQPNSTSFGLSAGLTVSGFQTGLKADQAVAPADGNPTTVIIDRAVLTGNATGINLGTGVIASGNVNNANSLVTNGAVTLSPGFQNLGSTIVNSTSPQVLTPPTADLLSSGNLTFTSTSTYAPLISGQSGTTTLFNFNNAADYSSNVIPSVPSLINGTYETSTPFGSLFNMNGNVTQTGNGQLVIGPGATNGTGFDLLYGTNSVPDPNIAGEYDITPIDLSHRTQLNVGMKLGPTNATSTIIIGLVDVNGSINLWTFPTSTLNTSTFTTLSVNLLAQGIPLALGSVKTLDLSHIIGYIIGGDQGLLTGQTGIPLEVSFDNMSAGSIGNAELNVSGSATLGGATLAGSISAGFTPSISQSFTIVHSTSPIIGTFAGLAQGGVTTIGGLSFSVNYTGGSGDDVVLTRIVPVVNSTVVGRKLFYNQSKFDGNTAGVSTSDDNAIAPDKTAYLPGGGATTFANLSSFSKGLNGIDVDISGAHGTITAADFTFKVGSNNTPSTWATAPAPTTVSVRAGAGTSGSDRVELIWANNAIQNNWLEVITKSNADTGLAQLAGNAAGVGDIFFFGDHIGDSGLGNSASFSVTSATDEVGARNNQGVNQPITNIYDYDRNGIVNATDQLISRNNAGNLRFVTIANPPAAPDASPAGDTGVASGLAALSNTSKAGLPAWLLTRLDNLDLNGGVIASYLQQLATIDSKGSRALLVTIDQFADDLDLNDDLLDSLLGDLGLE